MSAFILPSAADGVLRPTAKRSVCRHLPALRLVSLSARSLPPPQRCFRASAEPLAIRRVKCPSPCYPVRRGRIVVSGCTRTVCAADPPLILPALPAIAVHSVTV